MVKAMLTSKSPEPPSTTSSACAANGIRSHSAADEAGSVQGGGAPERVVDSALSRSNEATDGRRLIATGEPRKHDLRAHLSTAATDDDRGVKGPRQSGRRWVVP
mmetsp:Transcript_28002/g.50070  ORF Transcript_28002/g.50070 Transcript_28002/m.50070 type:complete len:104 (+) Transcript_28002:340-651(+)